MDKKENKLFIQENYKCRAFFFIFRCMDIITIAIFYSLNSTNDFLLLLRGLKI